jgi:Mrp family chromosome partitioning ATPase
LQEKFVEGHPKLAEIDGKIELLENQKRRVVSSYVQGRQINNQRYEHVRDSVDELEVELALATAKIGRIEQSLEEARGRMVNVPEIKKQKMDLDRDLAVAESMKTMLEEQLIQLQLQRVERPTKVQVLDPAIKPSDPISPQRERNVAIAIIIGLLLGVGLAFLLEEMEETVRTSDDVKNYLNLPVLGSIPYSAETINKLITDVPLKSPIAEAYRRLSFFTQLFCLDPPIKSLLVTSCKSDEGKSTTLSNMAISMAQEGTKVLIIDTDLRRPMLHRMFGIDNSLGLSSILTGELEAEIAVSDMSVSGRLPKESFMEVVVDRLIQPTNIKGLSVIPSGPLPANSIELLRSERMLSFLRTVEKKADIVIFDSPPSIHVIDAVVMAQILDGVLMVINSGRIDREEALQVKYMIESTKTPIIGVALNNIEASSPDYYYYYYYGGYGYGSRQRRKRVKLKR